MKTGFNSKASSISLAAMFAALTVIVLYLSYILPVGRISLYFISSIFVSGLLVERKPGVAIMMFVVVSLIALLIMPGFIYVLPYVLLFGHYGIGKYLIELIRDKIISFVLKLLYFNAGIFAIYFLCSAVLSMEILSTIPMWALVLGAQVAFVVFDFLYSKLTLFYVNSIRSKLVRR